MALKLSPFGAHTGSPTGAGTFAPAPTPPLAAPPKPASAPAPAPVRLQTPPKLPTAPLHVPAAPRPSVPALPSFAPTDNPAPHLPAPTAPATPAARSGASQRKAASSVSRETYSAQNRELPDGDLGKLIRKEGQAPSGDKTVDQAHDNAGYVYDFYKQVLGRDSLDGKGMKIKSTVHFGSNYNNAYWNGTSMTYGDGDGQRFGPLTGALDVVGHEMTHGVTERTAGLEYEFQPGALNESWSDVFGELIEQWHEAPGTFASPDGAKKADWQIGEDVFTPDKKGDALRSMKAPGTGYPGDPQPGHMRDYKKMSRFDDNGGVHINSGIPNKAAYESAMQIGSEKVAQIWYRALNDYMTPTAQFGDAANATIRAAKDLFASDASIAKAVESAWKSVGVSLSATAPDAPAEPTSATASPAPRHNPGIVPPWLTTPGAGGQALAGVAERAFSR